jgi:hypothetical protein
MIINDLISEEITQSDLFLGKLVSDLIKNIIKPLTAQKTTKILL